MNQEFEEEFDRDTIQNYEIVIRQNEINIIKVK